MIQDFQQTTMASSSIGLLAQATVCSSSAERGSETAGITMQILQSYLSLPVQRTNQPRRVAMPPRPSHRSPVKELRGIGGSSSG